MRPYIKWREKETERTRKVKMETIEKKIEENKELYMSEGKDGRPTIKWRRKQTTDTTGKGKETEDIKKGAKTEVEEKAETEYPA